MKGVELTQLTGAIRGPVGTSIELEIQRGSQVKKYQLQREWLRPNPQGAAARLGPDGIGWIRLKYLGIRSDVDVRKLWEELSAKGARRLILDLRNCPGELHGVAPMAGLFMPLGSVVYTLEKRKEQEKVVTSAPPVFSGPMAVIINDYSGDAAATLAGSLRDSDRAVLVGQPTKLSEMKAYRWLADELSDGSTITLVTQWLRLPRGQDLSHAPLQPDLAAKAGDPSGEVTGAKDDVAYQTAVRFLQKSK
jgi:carboxyl-terminal processing protease